MMMMIGSRIAAQPAQPGFAAELHPSNLSYNPISSWGGSDELPSFNVHRASQPSVSKSSRQQALLLACHASGICVITMGRMDFAVQSLCEVFALRSLTEVRLRL